MPDSNPSDNDAKAENASQAEIPPEAKEHWRRGNSLFDESKFMEAIAEYTKAIELYKDYSSAYFNRALNNLILKNYDAAKSDLEAVMEIEPHSADAPLLMGDIAEQNNDLIGARFWYEKSLSNDPNYAEAKNRLEHIDSLLHVNIETDSQKVNVEPESQSAVQESNPVQHQEEKEVIEDGQIKKLAFYKSKHTFKDVAGLEKVKKYLQENVVLAIRRPDLFKKYGKKLGIGLLLYGPPGVGKCVSADTEVVAGDGQLLTIKEAVEGKLPYVVTIDSYGNAYEGKVSGWWKLEGKPLMHIKTDSGRELKCTGEHPFLTKEGWLPAYTLAVGTEIAVPSYIPVFGNLSIDERRLSSLAHEVAAFISAYETAVESNGQQIYYMLKREQKEYRIPSYIFTLSKPQLSVFVKSLFSEIMKMGQTNAYCYAPESMLPQLRHLLLRFGINAAVDLSERKLKLDGSAFKLLVDWLIEGKLPSPSSSIAYEKISEISYAAAPDYVYDLTVEPTHNFIAADMLVHNTYIVDAVAGEAGANVIIARINQIVDMYTGNTEKNLHAVFQQAREHTPCIILFDEVDALGVKRSGGNEGGESSAMRLAVNQFLVEMNGVEANPEGIFVIGTTNQPWDMDPALKRSGRFGDSLYLRPPSYSERKALFEFHTKNKRRGHLSFGRLARATMGYSPADIEHICDRAAMKPLLHEYTYKKERLLTMHDFLSILKDKESSGSSLDEWYAMVKKEIISKTEEQIIDGKKQQIVKEGKLDAQEKVLYKAMIKDIKRNTGSFHIFIKKFMRWFALHIF